MKKIIFLYIIALVTLVARTYYEDRTKIQTFEVARLKTEIKKIQNENLLLENEIYRATSLNEISLKAINLGLVNPDFIPIKWKR